LCERVKGGVGEGPISHHEMVWCKIQENHF
jgi:hypothetical protein